MVPHHLAEVLGEGAATALGELLGELEGSAAEASAGTKRSPAAAAAKHVASGDRPPLQLAGDHRRPPARRRLPRARVAGAAAAVCSSAQVGERRRLRWRGRRARRGDARPSPRRWRRVAAASSRRAELLVDVVAARRSAAARRRRSPSTGDERALRLAAGEPIGGLAHRVEHRLHRLHPLFGD